jgi:hypothetical protein
MSRGSLLLRVCVAAAFAAWSIACSAPSLEDPRCAEAQDRVRRFYSLHFDRNGVGSGTDSDTRPYLSDRLASELTANQAAGADYFTAGDRFPKAFRVGTCTLRGDQNADIDVLMLWRDNEISDQRRINVKAVKPADNWVIDAVSLL